jgi:hypothetical protein
MVLFSFSLETKHSLMFDLTYSYICTISISLGEFELDSLEKLAKKSCSLEGSPSDPEKVVLGL